MMKNDSPHDENKKEKQPRPRFAVIAAMCCSAIYKQYRRRSGKGA